MTDNINKTVSNPFTHTAYLFIRTGVRKGKVFGYWKDGGKFAEGTTRPFAFIDMLPRGGWDGGIQFVKFGDPPPGQTEPERPAHGGGHGDAAGGEEEPES